VVTFTSIYNIVPNVYTPLPLLPNFCATPTPHRKEKKKEKEEKMEGVGQEAAIIFGEMLICRPMVATPVEAVYKYCSNIFGHNLRPHFQSLL
jgi:hypothetical protein